MHTLNILQYRDRGVTSTLHEHILCILFSLLTLFIYSSMCAQITREQLDLDYVIPYPPVIKLTIKQLLEDSEVEVDVLGITEKGKQFILSPKPRQSKIEHYLKKLYNLLTGYCRFAISVSTASITKHSTVRTR